jgi:serine/threonine protein kinase
MAVVYRGFDRALKREVAVKVLHQHLADSREARERFEREALAGLADVGEMLVQYLDRDLAL